MPVGRRPGAGSGVGLGLGVGEARGVPLPATLLHLGVGPLDLRQQRGAPGERLRRGVVLDERAGTSFLLVLDAQSLGEVARAELPHPVLFGYHGRFYED